MADWKDGETRHTAFAFALLTCNNSRRPIMVAAAVVCGGPSSVLRADRI